MRCRALTIDIALELALQLVDIDLGGIAKKMIQ